MYSPSKIFKINDISSNQLRRSTKYLFWKLKISVEAAKQQNILFGRVTVSVGKKNSVQLIFFFPQKQYFSVQFLCPFLFPIGGRTGPGEDNTTRGAGHEDNRGNQPMEAILWRQERQRRHRLACIACNRDELMYFVYLFQTDVSNNSNKNVLF